MSTASAARREIPEATVARLPLYLRALASLDSRGVEVVSSEELAEAAGVRSAGLRKDLSHLGSYGVRGVGYDVARLTEEHFSSLQAAPLRIGALDLPVPFAPELEQAFRPTKEKLIDRLAAWIG